MKILGPNVIDRKRVTMKW